MDNGYVNIEYVAQQGLAWNFIIGGRATGKTYTSLLYHLEHHNKIMFLRRSQTQVEMVTNDAFSPYGPINEDRCEHAPIGFDKAAKNVYGIYEIFEATDEKGRTIRELGENYGYATSLHAIKNLRGFNASQLTWMVFDEFIPEPHEKEVREEGQAILNAYETINRNRELKGSEPLRALFLANTNNIASTILVDLGLVTIVTKLLKQCKEEYIDRDRSIGVWMLRDSPISKQKESTVLYRVAPSVYRRMALENDFSPDFNRRVVSRSLKEYRPLFAIGEICIYKHKSKELYYCTTHASGSYRIYGTTKDDIAACKADNRYLWFANLDGLVEFESELCHILLTKLKVL